MSVAMYVRVSKRSQNTASQLPDTQRWAKGQDDDVKWFTDKATGKNMDRPAFNAMMEAVRSGEVKTVVVWRLDRLGRTCKGLVTLFEEFRTRKVNFISLRDGIDLSTPAGRMMANILASVAEYETELRSERVRAGLDIAIANGVKLGRKVGIRTPIKVTPEKAALVVKLKAEGQSVSGIASAVSLSRPTVYAILAG